MSAQQLEPIEALLPRERAALVRLHDASFGYGAKVLLEHVDVAVSASEFLCIVGSNGSGKTTLLRGLLGLLAPLAGHLEFAAGSPPACGYVPQRDALDPVYPLTVREVVELGAAARLNRWGRVRREDRDEARVCLERVDLADRERDLFASLSGGQRQRVLIARALLMRPQLLCLDEPTSGADPVAEQRITALLRELARERRMAVVMVGHHLTALTDAVDGVIAIGGDRFPYRPRRLEPEALRDSALMAELYSGSAVL